MLTEQQFLDDTIRREGEQYTNRPSDRGGPTKYGITLATLRSVRGPHVTAEDVRALTEPEARELYREVYMRRPGFSQIPNERLRVLLTDYGINSGPATAIRALQRAVGAKVDGALGPETLGLLASSSSAEVYAAVMRARLSLYSNMALSTPEVRAFLKAHPRAQLHNLAGWLNRFAEFL